CRPSATAHLSRTAKAGRFRSNRLRRTRMPSATPARRAYGACSWPEQRLRSVRRAGRERRATREMSMPFQEEGDDLDVLIFLQTAGVPRRHVRRCVIPNVADGLPLDVPVRSRKCRTDLSAQIRTVTLS